MKYESKNRIEYAVYMNYELKPPGTRVETRPQWLVFDVPIIQSDDYLLLLIQLQDLDFKIWFQDLKICFIWHLFFPLPADLQKKIKLCFSKLKKQFHKRIKAVQKNSKIKCIFKKTAWSDKKKTVYNLHLINIIS